MRLRKAARHIIAGIAGLIPWLCATDARKTAEARLLGVLVTPARCSAGDARTEICDGTPSPGVNRSKMFPDDACVLSALRGVDPERRIPSHWGVLIAVRHKIDVLTLMGLDFRSSQNEWLIAQSLIEEGHDPDAIAVALESMASCPCDERSQGCGDCLQKA